MSVIECEPRRRGGEKCFPSAAASRKYLWSGKVSLNTYHSLPAGKIKKSNKGQFLCLYSTCETGRLTDKIQIIAFALFFFHAELKDAGCFIVLLHRGIELFCSALLLCLLLDLLLLFSIKSIESLHVGILRINSWYRHASSLLFCMGTHPWSAIHFIMREIHFPKTQYIISYFRQKA